MCYGAGTTFCVYSYFRQQILTIQASTTYSVSLYNGSALEVKFVGWNRGFTLVTYPVNTLHDYTTRNRGLNANNVEPGAWRYTILVLWVFAFFCSVPIPWRWVSINLFLQKFYGISGSLSIYLGPDVLLFSFPIELICKVWVSDDE